MRYIHFRDDFSIEERFYTDDGNGGRIAINVPDRVEVSYFTADGRGCFTAKRDGNTYENCELSEDGKALIVYVSLRNRPIGHGRILKVATQITADASFPDGLKYTRTPGKVDAVLYLGKTDGALDVTSETVFGLTGITLEQVWASLQNNADFPNETLHLAHIPSIPISRIEGLQEALDSLTREILPPQALLPFSEGMAWLASRVTSLEEWFASPVIDEAFIQLLDTEEINAEAVNAVEINGVRAILSDTLHVEGLATLMSGLLLSATRRIYFGDTDHYLELTDDGEFHFSHGVFSDDFISADGTGSGGGGGGGTDLVQVWTSLANRAVTEAEVNATIKIATDHIPNLPMSKILDLQSTLAGYLLATTAASTYATIGTVNNLSTASSMGIASLSGRVASLEEWFASPVLDEAFIQLLDVDEIDLTGLVLAGTGDGVLNMNGTPLFSALANSGSQISITIGGQTRTLTVEYASRAQSANSATTATYATYATNDSSGRNIVDTYQTIVGSLGIQETLSTGIGDLAARVASLEEWIETPALSEAFIQLLNAEELNIGRATLSDTLHVEGLATLMSGLLLSGTRRIYFGDTDHYLELTDDGEFHFSHGVFSDDFISADGVGSSGGSGGGGTDLVQVWTSLANRAVTEAEVNATIKIATDHIPNLPMSKILDLQSTLVGKQATISDLSTIRENASKGATAYGWGDHAGAGYLLATTAASTYATIGTVNNLSTASSMGIASLSGRVASLEEWFASPVLDEAFIQLLDVDEIDLTGLVLAGTGDGVLNMNGTPLFSALANSGSQISITIGGQTRTLTVGYATSAYSATNSTNATNATNATYATYATYATNDSSGRNIVDTYQTIARDQDTQMSIALGIGGIASRVASLEEWFAAPTLGEAFIQLLNVEEINGSKALLQGTLDVTGYAYLRSRLYLGGSAQSYIEWDAGESGIHVSTGLYTDDYLCGDGVSVNSDARLKKNLKDVKLKVSQIAKARAVTFDWIDEEKGRSAGSIAQDWEELIPESVHTWGNGMLSLEYGNVALIAAITIAREVESMQRKIEKIEKHLNIS